MGGVGRLGAARGRLGSWAVARRQPGDGQAAAGMPQAGGGGSPPERAISAKSSANLSAQPSIFRVESSDFGGTV